MLRNYYFFRVLIILLSFYLTNSVYSQDNLIKDSINPYCQANDIDEFFQDKKTHNKFYTEDNDSELDYDEEIIAK